MWIASAIYAHFFSSSVAALEPVEMQSDNPFFLERALYTAIMLHAKDLPICLADSQIFLLWLSSMNFLWYGRAIYIRFIYDFNLRFLCYTKDGVYLLLLL